MSLAKILARVQDLGWVAPESAGIECCASDSRKKRCLFPSPFSLIGIMNAFDDPAQVDVASPRSEAWAASMVPITSGTSFTPKLYFENGERNHETEFICRRSIDTALHNYFDSARS